MFPTEKPHVSYSEVRTWKECPYRHKLTYIDKIEHDDPSQYLDYGILLHESLENFLKTREIDINLLKSKLENAWQERGYDTKEYIEQLTEKAKLRGEKPRILQPLDEWLNWAEVSMGAIPEFMDTTFPNWTTVSAEHQLYEPIPADSVKFKGFVDAVIESDYRKNKRKIWILDWKTAGAYGWNSWKRRDFLVQAQIALYKKFWRIKQNYECSDVGAGFVLLKRGAKKNPVDFFKVSVGPKTEEKSEKLLRSMLKTVRTGLFIKNRNSCKYCPFYETKHCT
jgi:ATP-dependent exoDNAse (exonuclease V) beta subunit